MLSVCMYVCSYGYLQNLIFNRYKYFCLYIKYCNALERDTNTYIDIKELEHLLLISDNNRCILAVSEYLVQKRKAISCQLFCLLYCLEQLFYCLLQWKPANKQVSNNISGYHVQCNIS